MIKPKLNWSPRIIATAVAVSVIACASASEIPKPVRDVVFKSSRFAKPVQMNIPIDDAAGYRQLKQKYPDGKVGGFLELLPVGVTIGYQNSEKSLRSFLVRHGYVKILSLTLSGRETKRYRFFVYTDKLRELVRESEQPDVDLNPGYRRIDVAHRDLKSIDYQKNYKMEIHGVEIKVYALTFSYTLDTQLPGLPEIDSVFTGKAKAYLDIDDGHWKLKQLSLSDSGGSSYRDLLKG